MKEYEKPIAELVIFQTGESIMLQELNDLDPSISGGFEED